MSGFSAATAHWPVEQVHREVFLAPGTDMNKAFDVVIDSNGERIIVAANETLSQTLQRAGYGRCRRVPRSENCGYRPSNKAGVIA